MCRQRRSSPAAIPCLENLGYLFRGQSAATDLQERSRNCPNHILKKAVAPDSKDPFALLTAPGCLINGPHPVLHPGCGGAKRCEIMLADEVGCTAVHRALIQRVTKCMNVTAVKRAHNRISPYPILICFRAGAAPRVEILMDFFDSQDADLEWKQCIHSAQHRIGTHCAYRSNIRNLTMGMNTGIRAARAGH